MVDTVRRSWPRDHTAPVHRAADSVQRQHHRPSQRRFAQLDLRRCQDRQNHFGAKLNRRDGPEAVVLRQVTSTSTTSWGAGQLAGRDGAHWSTESTGPGAQGVGNVHQPGNRHATQRRLRSTGEASSVAANIVRDPGQIPAAGSMQFSRPPENMSRCACGRQHRLARGAPGAQLPGPKFDLRCQISWRRGVKAIPLGPIFHGSGRAQHHGDVAERQARRRHPVQFPELLPDLCQLADARRGDEGRLAAAAG